MGRETIGVTIKVADKAFMYMGLVGLTSNAEEGEKKAFILSLKLILVCTDVDFKV